MGCEAFGKVVSTDDKGNALLCEIESGAYKGEQVDATGTFATGDYAGEAPRSCMPNMHAEPFGEGAQYSLEDLQALRTLLNVDKTRLFLNLNVQQPGAVCMQTIASGTGNQIKEALEDSCPEGMEQEKCDALAEVLPTSEHQWSFAEIAGLVVGTGIVTFGMATHLGTDIYNLAKGGVQKFWDSRGKSPLQKAQQKLLEASENVKAEQAKADAKKKAEADKKKDKSDNDQDPPSAGASGGQRVAAPASEPASDESVAKRKIERDPAIWRLFRDLADRLRRMGDERADHIDKTRKKLYSEPQSESQGISFSGFTQGASEYIGAAESAGSTTDSVSGSTDTVDGVAGTNAAPVVPPVPPLPAPAPARVPVPL